MTDHVLPALVMALVAGALGHVAPRVLVRLPEPDPGSSLDGETKLLYADLAVRPRLAVRLAIAAALAAAAIGWRLGFDASLPVWCLLCALGVLLAYVDWRTRLLPFRLVAPAYPVVAVLLVLATLLSGDWHALGRAVIAWLVVYAVFTAMWAVYRRGLGYGDVRLSGILAAPLGWLGWSTLVVGVYAGFVLGAVGGIILSALRLVDRKAFAFGPFMLAGAWLGVVLGPTITSWLD